MCQCYIAGVRWAAVCIDDEFAIWHKLHESDIIFTHISYKIVFISMFIGIKLLGFAGVIIFPTALIVTVKYYGGDN